MSKLALARDRSPDGDHSPGPGSAHMSWLNYLKHLHQVINRRGAKASRDKKMFPKAHLDIEVLEKRWLMSVAGMGEFTVPTTGGNPLAITNGPDGNLWFIEAGKDKIAKV